MTHLFSIGQEVTSKRGALYRVVALRDGSHRKLAGEVGYAVIGLRAGRDFGPIRLVRESGLRAAPVDADFTPEAA